MALPEMKRVLLKLSGEVLMGEQGYGIDPAFVMELAKEVKAAKDHGLQICLVIGGGNIFRGMAGAAQICAGQGIDLEGLEGVQLPQVPVHVSWLYTLAHVINRTPSLYLEAGAIHGTVLCHRDRPLVYMEDVGRHNAVDKVAGWMAATGTGAEDKILYTTGRLTSEMVIKTALMGIPVLVSRSGFTAWGVEIAQAVGLTLIGRMRGERFVCLSGDANLVRDAQNGAAE